MLAFYTTDAAVSPALLEKALKTVVPGTYNQMSVDLDTSTNDTLIIMASGLAGNPEICEETVSYTHLDVYKRQVRGLPAGHQLCTPLHCKGSGRYRH